MVITTVLVTPYLCLKVGAQGEIRTHESYALQAPPLNRSGTWALKWCAEWDSNPHCTDFKSVACCQLGYQRIVWWTGWEFNPPQMHCKCFSPAWYMPAHKHFYLVVTTGYDPVTFRLSAECSTNWATLPIYKFIIKHLASLPSLCESAWSWTGCLRINSTQTKLQFEYCISCTNVLCLSLLLTDLDQLSSWTPPALEVLHLSVGRVPRWYCSKSKTDFSSPFVLDMSGQNQFACSLSQCIRYYTFCFCQLLFYV